MFQNTVINLGPLYKKALPWIVCLSAALFFFYDFVQLNMISSIGTPLINEYQLNATQLGHLAATHLYAQLGFLLISGYLLDRFSTRVIILVGMAVCVFSSFWFAQAYELWALHAARAASGATGAFCFLSCIVLATKWFPPKQMATITGVVVTMAMFGGAMAQQPLDILVASYGWRQAVMINSFIGFSLRFLMVR